ncbi:PucR family transcriptional regulator [Lapillicoccus jejuensis]|uniref:PucR-like helix-turn-helix protein n=1 Tax=Lapillicoccus jejuensis TaxID=402171 RepID=A0A542E611_9MICO|nr:helix-turn-helix domain-containing protein [Lapillicoccus jejuensis]TQJ10781.1 PucR-like helix-turn-helix protein [Lapillicoccus jejuensis]
MTSASAPQTRLGTATRRRLEGGAGALTAAALRRMEADHGWYRALGAEDRSWLTLVVQAAVSSFLTWLQDDAVGDASPRDPVMREVFAEAPRELTRAINLAQTLELVRTVVDVVEHEVASYAGRTDERTLREAVLRYSREVAFGAAEVYAAAAESRGAWDARLEALVVDAVVRGEADDSMQSRATALGWGSVQGVAVVAGSPARDVGAAAAVDAVRRAAAREGVEALAALQRRRLVVILGGLRPPATAGPEGTAARPATVVAALAEHFGEGPVVLGPTVPHLFAAGRSARAALSGLAAVAAWPAAPRPVLADDLLPERVLGGDGPARRTLVNRVHHPLAQHPALLATATEFLEQGRSLEATARALYVHPNTVRYRLGRVAALVGYDLTTPREALAVQVALAVGRLAEPEPRPWRSGVTPRGAAGPPTTRLEDSSNGHPEDSWASVPPDEGPTGEA